MSDKWSDAVEAFGLSRDARYQIITSMLRQFEYLQAPIAEYLQDIKKRKRNHV